MTKPTPRPCLALAFCLVLSCLVLVGCGRDEPDRITFDGRLTMPAQGVDLGSDASARISLIQRGGEADEDRIIAERTLHDIGQPPVRFRLVVGRALIDSGDQYGLAAQIMNADGDVTWQTATPQTVKIVDDPRSTTLTLQGDRVSPDGPFTMYRCSDGFRFQLARDSRAAIVHLGRRQISLHIGRSIQPGSVRYVDEHKDEIVIGNGVTSIYFDGISHHDCDPVTTATGGDRASGKS